MFTKHLFQIQGKESLLCKLKRGITHLDLQQLTRVSSFTREHDQMKQNWFQSLSQTNQKVTYINQYLESQRILPKMQIWHQSSTNQDLSFHRFRLLKQGRHLNKACFLILS
ncbi:hypothetical protein FGO68_gene7003 [Halteria grandinella]|uniref:Uncharacterized protein n=1 Tax=Halteria grandinella TaxID=5974 RepID=A0A8J8T9E6_HALGN|nr:hypothetical protein FGO68_gene7003 [Halteria grandinella]